MKTVTLVVERVIEERYTLTLDSRLGSKNLNAALSDVEEMAKYRKAKREIGMRIVGQKEVPVLFRKRKN